MKKLYKAINILTLVTIGIYSKAGYTFQCKLENPSTGWFSDGDHNVHVNLAPTVQSGGNIIVDLNNYMTCKHEGGGKTKDRLWFQYANIGTKFNGYNVTAIYGGAAYRLPMPNTTIGKNMVDYSENQHRRVDFKFILSPVSAAGGIPIKRGDHIGDLFTYKNTAKSPTQRYFVWRIYANNDVAIPTGTCDVSQRNLTVNLPNYNINNVEASVPLQVKCTRAISLKFLIDGVMSPGSTDIFKNIHTGTAARGIGISVTRDGSPIRINTPVDIGRITNNFVDLRIKVGYKKTNIEPLSPGEVRSIINVNFTYN